jgi:hypothetical protein
MAHDELMSLPEATPEIQAKANPPWDEAIRLNIGRGSRMTENAHDEARSR